MNNEKKAPVLTLEHLAPYLPYGVHAQSENADFIITGATTEEVIGDNDLGEQTWDYDEEKPHYRFYVVANDRRIYESAEIVCDKDWQSKRLKIKV